MIFFSFGLISKSLILDEWPPFKYGKQSVLHLALYDTIRLGIFLFIMCQFIQIQMCYKQLSLVIFQYLSTFIWIPTLFLMSKGNHLSSF
jgi:hypothetical protein